MVPREVSTRADTRIIVVVTGVTRTSDLLVCSQVLGAQVFPRSLFGSLIKGETASAPYEPRNTTVYVLPSAGSLPLLTPLIHIEY
jgi:hypothetical protein